MPLNPTKEGSNRFFPKRSHIKKAGDFKEVFSKGKFFGSGYFKIGVLKNSLNYARFGICIPKGATRKATVRNRLKRQIRESIRLNRDRIKKGFDIVLILRPTLKTPHLGPTLMERGRPVLSGLKISGGPTLRLESETIKNSILKALFDSGVLR